MSAIGFWGVGSIINAIPEGGEVKKGQYMGHFGYGGSSIVLAFEPNLDLLWTTYITRLPHTDKLRKDRAIGCGVHLVGQFHFIPAEQLRQMRVHVHEW